MACEGWRMLAGLTASVVDGAGGVVVLGVDSHGAADGWAALADGGKIRGGFVPAARRDG